MRCPSYVRVSIAEAFKAAKLPLPADFLKSNTSNRDGSPCVRSVHQPAFCVTASHPHTWCTRVGETVRCLKPSESAVLMGFPRSWRLPLGSRVGTRAVGNAVSISRACNRERVRRHCFILVSIHTAGIQSTCTNIRPYRSSDDAPSHTPVIITIIITHRFRRLSPPPS